VTREDLPRDQFEQGEIFFFRATERFARAPRGILAIEEDIVET